MGGKKREIERNREEDSNGNFFSKFVNFEVSLTRWSDAQDLSANQLLYRLS
jgi:hypothetical protein